MNSYISEQSPAGDKATITVSSTAIPLTSTKVRVLQISPFHKNCVMAFISVETNSIRVWWDGSTPTTSVGHLLAANDTLQIAGEQNVANLKMIATGSDATVQVTFYYNI